MVFWRRRPLNPGPVMLLEPASGALTAPLQQFQLPAGPSADPDLPAADGLSRPGNAWWNPQMLSPDRSFPQSVVFRWLPPPGIRRALRYDLLLGLDPELADPLVIRDLSEPVARVRHLRVDTVYYWRVFALLRGEPVSASGTSSFRTHAALPRWIRVPHMTNVRDLGGWPVAGGLRVRQGLVYRSSEMNGHLTLSAEGREVLLDELRLRTDLDLREPEEEPGPALPEARVRYVNIPILPYDRILQPETMAAGAGLFEMLGQAETYPVLIHCRAGADRAATVAFLLQAALGVERPDLEMDYELSSLSLWGERSRRGPGFQAFMAALATCARSPADSVNQQVLNYLQMAGVSAETVARLRALLLEPQPSAPTPETW
jgi:protein-tyrosine phosphatase